MHRFQRNSYQAKRPISLDEGHQNPQGWDAILDYPKQEDLSDNWDLLSPAYREGDKTISDFIQTSIDQGQGNYIKFPADGKSVALFRLRYGPWEDPFSQVDNYVVLKVVPKIVWQAQHYQVRTVCFIPLSPLFDDSPDDS